jgi:hypothetical protein
MDNTYTVTISDWNAGTFIFTNTTGRNDITYTVGDNITLTNS